MAAKLVMRNMSLQTKVPKQVQRRPFRYRDAFREFGRGRDRSGNPKPEDPKPSRKFNLCFRASGFRWLT